MSTRPQDASVAEQVKLAAQAYIYGYPLVRSLDEIGSFVAGGGSLPGASPSTCRKTRQISPWA